MLAELMRFRNAIAIGGTHGKTTTTSMVGTLLEAGGLDPTVINGGIINAYGTNARMGEGEWMVVEADESDGTFLKLPADIAVVTNIDPEHLDHYGTFDEVRAAFRQFVENVPFYGFGVMCLDHPEVQAMVAAIEDRQVITYGENPQADVRFTNDRIDGAASIFDVEIRAAGPARRRASRTCACRCRAGTMSPTPRPRSPSPTSSAFRDEEIRKGLRRFAGVKRRFTLTGAWNGVADLRRLRPSSGRDQGGAEGGARRLQGPRHRRSRSRIAIRALHNLFDEFAACFNDADTVFIAPIYAAGEEPIEGVNSEELVSRINAGGHRDARFIDPEALAPSMRELPSRATLSSSLGAGNITHWADALPKELRR